MLLNMRRVGTTSPLLTQQPTKRIINSSTSTWNNFRGISTCRTPPIFFSSSFASSVPHSPSSSSSSSPYFVSSVFSSVTWRSTLLQQRVFSSSSSKNQEKEKDGGDPSSKSQSKDNKGKETEKGKKKKGKEEAENPFDEAVLKRRAERMHRQAQIKKGNRIFWLVVFGVVFGYIFFEKRLEMAELEEERSRLNSNAKLVLHVAGACLNKNIPLEFASRALKNQDDCGEDAFFITTSAFGVADGVGGWRSKGVDPSKISRQLMVNTQHFMEEAHRKQKEQGINSFLMKEHPKDILEKAYKKIVSNAEVDAGSTTACVVAMSPSDDKTETNPVIRGANLGDSGFLVIRNGKEIFRSQEQQQPGHFNAPLQLAIIPPSLAGKGGSQPMFYSNQPSEADSISLISQPGDIIVMGTDGLFDNMFDAQIVDIALRSFERERIASGQADTFFPGASSIYNPRSGSQPGNSSNSNSSNLKLWVPEEKHCRKVAEDVLLKAKEGATNTRWHSPYAQKARAAGDLKTGLGGKMDDITVVIGVIGGEASASPPSTSAPQVSQGSPGYRRGIAGRTGVQ